MVYISNKDKVKTFFEKTVLETLKLNDIDYNRLVKCAIQETGANEKTIKEFIQSYIDIRKIEEIHILTIPKSQIDEFLDILKVKEQREEETKKDLEDLNKMLGGEKK